MSTSPVPQLHMLWPSWQCAVPPEVELQPDYRLRIFSLDDTDAYLALMHRAGFTSFDSVRVTTCLQQVLPDGFFVVEHRHSTVVVATAMANHAPKALHPFGGEVGWVAGDPDHSGRGLGRVVCSAATRRLLAAGYRRVYLSTDDWRLPAIKVYLSLGFEPLLFDPGMPDRWQAVCQKLNWPFTPDAWPRS